MQPARFPALCSSMPPLPHAYRGRALVPTRAIGKPAFGAYLCTRDGTRQGVGLIVLGISGDRISELTRFDERALVHFGLAGF